MSQRSKATKAPIDCNSVRRLEHPSHRMAMRYRSDPNFGRKQIVGDVRMLRIEAGSTGKYCDGHSRRSFLQVGLAGMATVGLPQILKAKEESVELGNARKNTSVILLWLDGGPGHMDLYDLKPEAPVEYRGIWNPISTNVDGFEISELFPRQARVADRFSIV